MIPGQKIVQRKRAKTHGFFARKLTMKKLGKKGESAVIKRRRAKGRERVVVQTRRAA